jgi:hypothetical protein
MHATLRFGDSNHIRFADAIAAIGEARVKRAFSRAINHTGRKMGTRVIRALAPQVGLTQAKVREFGNIFHRRANVANLEYRLKSSGTAISLREFNARQFGYGVRAKPWGQSQQFKSAFIFAGFPGSGNPVSGGHVFVRTSGSSFPINMLHGPSIPKEIVRGDSADAFGEVGRDLEPRIAHEIRAITNGIVS